MGSDRNKHIRNVAIILALAVAVWKVPGGGTASATISNIFSVLFLARPVLPRLPRSTWSTARRSSASRNASAACCTAPSRCSPSRSSPPAGCGTPAASARMLWLAMLGAAAWALYSVWRAYQHVLVVRRTSFPPPDTVTKPCRSVQRSRQGWCTMPFTAAPGQRADCSRAAARPSPSPRRGASRPARGATASAARSRRTPGERGQASVELVVLLPVDRRRPGGRRSRRCSRARRSGRRGSPPGRRRGRMRSAPTRRAAARSHLRPRLERGLRVTEPTTATCASRCASRRSCLRSRSAARRRRPTSGPRADEPRRHALRRSACGARRAPRPGLPPRPRGAAAPGGDAGAAPVRPTSAAVRARRVRPATARPGLDRAPRPAAARRA